MGNANRKKKNAAKASALLKKKKQEEEEEVEQPPSEQEEDKPEPALETSSEPNQEEPEPKQDDPPEEEEEDVAAVEHQEEAAEEKEDEVEPVEQGSAVVAESGETTSDATDVEVPESKRMSSARRSTRLPSTDLPVVVDPARSVPGFEMDIKWDETQEWLTGSIRSTSALKTTYELRLIDSSASEKDIVTSDWKAVKAYSRIDKDYGPSEKFDFLWTIPRPESSFSGYLAVALVATEEKELLAVSQSFKWPGSVPREDLFPAPDTRFTASWDSSAQGIKLDWSAVKEFQPTNMMYVFLYQASERDKSKQLFLAHHKRDEEGVHWFGSQGKLKEGAEYYARLMDMRQNNAYESLLTSPTFKVTGLKNAAAVSNLCQLKLEGTEVDVGDGYENLEVTFTWSFPSFIAGLSERDTITLVEAGTAFQEDKWDFPQAYASGKLNGKVKVCVGGLVSPSKSYDVYYVLRLTDKPQVLGKTEKPVAFSTLPKQSAEADAKAKAASERANANSTQQYTLQDAMAKVVDLNPLLTITPEPSLWEKLSAKQEARRKKRRNSADERAAKEARELESKTAQNVKADQEKPLNADELRALVESDFSEKVGFIYAGAGVSMAAPSSSPSWWLLMNELLKATFQGAPDDHAYFREKVITGDVTRQPEEIMESFYFTLQDRLLTVFELLEAGEPNANHKAMAALVKAGKVTAIMTTNFDLFIERALREAGVAFQTIVTQEEFESFYKGGCKGVAVLKIHGSVDRPSTIVAVANHYKNGKGFSGYKEKVLSFYLRQHPTLFLGYSGWDWEHANYQNFLAGEGEAGGRNLYWLNLVGARGPNLKKIVGTHVGRRLLIGEGFMPDWALTVLDRWDPASSSAIRTFNAGVKADEINKALVVKRNKFLKDWVAKIPKPDLLTLLSLEAGYLNGRTQERFKRQKANKADAESEDGTDDQQAMIQFLTKLGTDFAAGKLTYEQYMEETQIVTVKMTFKFVYAPKAKKDALIRLYMKEIKANPLFAGSEAWNQLYKNMVPMILSNLIQGQPDTTSAEDLFDMAVRFFAEKIEALRIKGDPISMAKRLLYLYQNMYLQCDEVGQAKCEALFEEFAQNAVKNKWSETKITSESASQLTKKIMAVAYDTIDLIALLDTECNSLLEMKDDTQFIRSAMNVALGAQRGALYRVMDVQSTNEFQKLVLFPLNADAKREVPVSGLKSFEKVLHEKRSKPLKSVLERLKRLKAEEVLAVFEMGDIDLWIGMLGSMGARFADEKARESKGFYPRSSMPIAVAQFLKPKLEQCQRIIKDARAVQLVLKDLTLVAESLDDLPLMQLAANESLKLTNGKVLEVTPVGIPEALAFALQIRGKFPESLEYYLKALDGIKTSVTRDNTDAIVLQACLVQAITDKEKALRLAFVYSPHFGSAQQFTRVSAARSLLVQQCERWAKDLGYDSLEQAEEKLMTRE